ncbi:mannose-1-phosphate guanylyltransferase [candidate division WOR-3 bacterium]|nr:mannose-1-phosphate guanylyltransferase [candidate division WOR-3 bacterium]
MKKENVAESRQEEDLIYAVVLAGGKGERFWPRSRKYLPKQLINIVDTKTMVETTIERVSSLIPLNRIYIVASEITKENLQNIDLMIPSTNYLFEPRGRNTAPAVGLAAFTLSEIVDDSIMVVLPADHYITDVGSFLECIKRAVEVSKKGYLVTFGIVPSRPETGYGYIECGEEISESVCKVRRFKEKPSQKKANEFVKKEKFLWNSGIFVWQTKRIIEEFHKFQPELSQEMEQYVQKEDDEKKKILLERIYNEIETISIDYAIMEKSTRVAVVRASFGWDDVGSWNALERLIKKDANGNIRVGDVVSIDTEDSIIVAERGVIGTIGISNLIVVHTEDATLILPKDRSQEVKEIVRRLNTHKKLEKYT